MSEQLMIQHCSPTLAGLKTANLFTCPCADREELYRQMRDWNCRLREKGLRVLPLRLHAGRALVYLYRPARLCEDLKDRTAERLLQERGYPAQNPQLCLMQLMRRIEESETAEFPHEIGLFLGYPPEDVCGFIENRAECCKCVGCWKVYGNEAEAKKTFAKFKKCTAVYSAQYESGSSLERLAVAG